MKISLITVTYNSEKYLRHCINSVLEQDYADIEYIIIDGGSSDGTVDIIKSYSSKISKWISEPDAGLYNAINKGILLATGEIVGILHSDDFLADKQVITRVAAAFSNNKADIIFADVDYVSPDLTKTKRHYSSEFFRPWMFRFGFQPAHPTFYTYRENFFKYGLYREDMEISGDFELLLRYLYIHQLPYGYVKDTWVKMRTGGVSSSGFKNKLKLNMEIVRSFELNGLYTNFMLVISKYIFKWWGFIGR